MIAVDTNLLVYAHRRDSAWHEAASGALRGLAEGRGAWAIPWPCLHEFLAIVTHPRIFSPPTDLADALAQIDAWLAAPGVSTLAETARYWRSLHEMVDASQTTGPRIHDARVAALCHCHGVRELWTADRDFSRFPAVTVRNPLVS